MKHSDKKLILQTADKSMMRWLLTAIICLLATACASTGGQQDKTSRSATAPAQQIKTSCTPAGTAQTPQQSPQQPGQQNAQQAGQAPTTQAQQNCLPRGVIEITENFPVDPEIRGEFQQAVMLLKEEKYSDAIRLLKGVTGKTSKFSGPFIDLGIAYARTNELDKAEASLKKALELNASHPVAMNEMGLVYRKTGRYKEARTLYESLLQLYPDYLPAHKNLGVLCDIYIQDLNCALEQYEAYLKGIPEDEKVKIWVADVKSRM